MHAGIAVPVADIQIAVAPLGDIGDPIERLAAVQHRPFVDNVSGIGRDAGLANHRPHFAARVEDADRVVRIVRQIDGIIAVDEDAVRAREYALAPRLQETSRPCRTR